MARNVYKNRPRVLRLAISIIIKETEQSVLCYIIVFGTDVRRHFQLHQSEPDAGSIPQFEYRTHAPADYLNWHGIGNIDNGLRFFLMFFNST